VNISHTAEGFCYTVTGGDNYLNVARHFNDEVKSHNKSRTNKTKGYRIYSVRKDNTSHQIWELQRRPRLCIWHQLKHDKGVGYS
jgi:hypothetical protein